MRLCKLFRDKGYSFADNDLSMGNSENLSDIKFILGSRDAGVLPIQTKTFGSASGVSPSSYLMTPIGVMLQGSVSEILKSASELPHFTSDSS